MIYYEIKKILSRTNNRIALVFLGIVLIITCYFAISAVGYVNEKGDTETGIAAAHKLKEEKQKWKGELTVEQIAAVIAENDRINRTEKALSSNVQNQNIAYGWKQGFSDIRNLIGNAYGAFREYDYYLVDNMKPEEASSFYENKEEQLKTWLQTEAKELYNEEEKEYLIKQYETLETPFYYDYADGWEQLLEFSATIIMITVLVLGFLLSGIFSRESQLKAEAIFYSSKFGRSKAITAKIVASFLITTVIYLGIILLYTLIVGTILGFAGADCAIQIKMSGWKSLYHITFLQKYLLTVVGGYVGSLFFSGLTIFVSAQTKSAVFSAMMPFILIFVPSFIAGISNPVVSKIVGLLPDQILQLSHAIDTFNLYKIDGVIIGALPILLLLYSILTLLVYPVTYFRYKKIEVK